jgi:acetolactate synthase regulatory subunit
MKPEAPTPVEVIVGDDPAVLSRIVRVVSTPPFSLARLHYGDSSDTKNRLVLMYVVAHGRAELLSKRLNRIVSVQRVRLLDQQTSSPPPRNRDDLRRPA